MSDLKAQFEAASVAVQSLPASPGNDVKLKLYALYKQGSEGDVQGERPGFTNMVGRVKYDAWANLQGTSQDDAMQQYIDLVNSLLG